MLITDRWGICSFDVENSKFGGFPGFSRNSILDQNSNRIFYDQESFRNVILDPNSNRMFVALESFIRVGFLIKDECLMSTLIGRSHRCGYAEGVGSDAELNMPCGMALTANGESLIFCDTANNLIRAVNINTRQSSHLASAISWPHHCVWNRLTVKPKTELFITSHFCIGRLDVTTSKFFSREAKFHAREAKFPAREAKFLANHLVIVLISFFFVR